MNDPKSHDVRKTMTTEHVDHERSPHALGKPETKPFIDTLGVLAVVFSLLSFLAACISVSSSTATPWRLGLKRQLQVVGLLLSVMNQALLLVMPKFFLIIEARYGKSRIQNFEAILRNSGFMSHTHLAWRATILSLIILPIGLSLAYKEFQQGFSSISGNSSLIKKGPVNFYGLGSPAQISWLRTESIGISLMTNATLPFALATQDDPGLPAFPEAYGFNNLLLSNTSAAALDGPMPYYISLIQKTLEVDETVYLTADVYATITAYNNTIESRRGDDDFWLYYNDKMNTSDLLSLEALSDLYNNHTFVLLVNDLRSLDTSFCLAAFVPSNQSNQLTMFQKYALLFDTRRASCTGKWRVTYDSISIVNGSCDQPALPASAQNIFKHASFAISKYFMPSLIEYLGPFSDARSQSQWIVPSFSIVLANTWWARATTLNGYQNWGDNKTVFVDPNPNATQRSDIYYQVDDHLTWERPTMNTSWALYFVFAIQPVLTILIFLADIFLRRTPIGRGFGLISLLAGIRVDSLRLLEGASFSGKLKKPLAVKITVASPPRSVDRGVSEHPKIEYVLDDEGQSGSWPSQNSRLLQTLSLSLPFKRRTRHETAYEMIDH